MRVSVVLASLSVLVGAVLAGCSSTATIGFKVEDPASVRSIFLVVGPQELLAETEPATLAGSGVRKSLDAFVQFLLVKSESGDDYKLEPPKNPKLGPGMSIAPTDPSATLEGSLELPRELGEKEKKSAMMIVRRTDDAATVWDKQPLSAKDVAEGATKEFVVGAESIVSP